VHDSGLHAIKPALQTQPTCLEPHPALQAQQAGNLHTTKSALQTQPHLHATKPNTASATKSAHIKPW
jgi:hypothetical protein